jgi:hypothetical protein
MASRSDWFGSRIKKNKKRKENVSTGGKVKRLSQKEIDKEEIVMKKAIGKC